MESITDTRKKVLSGITWKLIERSSTQFVQFVVQIILARLLLPKEYGIIALITIFVIIANVFVQSGFGTALIQKKKVDELDLSSVFYINIVMATILYLVLFFTAPLIASFYKEMQLISVLRILSLTLFFGAINSIQNAVVCRAMQFKRFFFSSLGGIIVSGFIGIVMANMGFGVWALVAQQLINNLLITGILWFTVNWRPQLIFSLFRLNELFSFGWKLLVSSLIDTLYVNIYGLIIGRLYNADMLGYYNRGDQFPNMIMSNVNGSISSVLLPVLSSNQDDRSIMKAMVRRSIVTSSFIIFPTMIGLAACAEPLVRLLLTDRWLPCVPFLQLMCISYAFWPIHTANLQVFNALGRSDIFLKLELIKKSIGILALCISVPFGIYVMVIFKVVISFISTLINAFPNKKLLNYSFKEQWKDIVPSLLISLVMGAVVYNIKWIHMTSGLTLIIQVVVGGGLYLLLARIYKLECLNYLVNTLKDLMEIKENGGIK